MSELNKADDKLLKRDLFGEVRLEQTDNGAVIKRDTRTARWWTRAIAKWLAGREARALTALAGMATVPALLRWDGAVLERVWLSGLPMQEARPTDRRYYAQALTILRQMHRAGVAHNDTAKEPNWLVRDDGTPALIDFQIAWCAPRRGRLFRLLAREDLRHLLKHKRTYRPDALTARQRQMLANPAWTARLWQQSGKRVYLWITRRLLGWSDREGAGDRHQS